MELGDELHAGYVSLKRFHDLFSQRLPFLGHIKLNAAYVLSHLGDIILVPIVFCSTWKVFISFFFLASIIWLRRLVNSLRISTILSVAIARTILARGLLSGTNIKWETRKKRSSEGSVAWTMPPVMVGLNGKLCLSFYSASKLMI